MRINLTACLLIATIASILATVVGPKHTARPDVGTFIPVSTKDYESPLDLTHTNGLQFVQADWKGWNCQTSEGVDMVFKITPSVELTRVHYTTDPHDKRYRIRHVHYSDVHTFRELAP